MWRFCVCFINELCEPKHWPHSIHWKGFSFVWIRLWIFRREARANCFWQYGHGNKLAGTCFAQQWDLHFARERIWLPHGSAYGLSMPAVWNILCHNARRYKIVSDGFSRELQRLTERRSWSHTADIGTLWCLSCALAEYVVLAKPRWSCKSHRLCRCACSSPCGRPRSVRPERSRSMWLFHRERRWKPPCGSSRGAPDPREHSLICEYDTPWYFVVLLNAVLWPLLSNIIQ